MTISELVRSWKYARKNGVYPYWMQREHLLFQIKLKLIKFIHNPKRCYICLTDDSDELIESLGTPICRTCDINVAFWYEDIKKSQQENKTVTLQYRQYRIEDWVPVRNKWRNTHNKAKLKHEVN